MEDKLYPLFECGVIFSVNGWATWSIYWSDGSVTTYEKRVLSAKYLTVIHPIGY